MGGNCIFQLTTQTYLSFYVEDWRLIDKEELNPATQCDSITCLCTILSCPAAAATQRRVVRRILVITVLCLGLLDRKVLG